MCHNLQLEKKGLKSLQNKIKQPASKHLKITQVCFTSISVPLPRTPSETVEENLSGMAERDHDAIRMPQHETTENDTSKTNENDMYLDYLRLIWIIWRIFNGGTSLNMLKIKSVKS